MLSIASRLAEIRASLGFSARMMAGELTANGYPVSDVTVLAYEKEEGTQKVPGAYLAAICRVYGVSPVWMLLGEGPRRLRELDAARTFRDGARSVVEWFDALTDALKAHYDLPTTGVHLEKADAAIQMVSRTEWKGERKRAVRRPTAPAADDRGMGRLAEDLKEWTGEDLPPEEGERPPEEDQDREGFGT